MIRRILQALGLKTYYRVDYYAMQDMNYSYDFVTTIAVRLTRDEAVEKAAEHMAEACGGCTTDEYADVIDRNGGCADYVHEVKIVKENA